MLFRSLREFRKEQPLAPEQIRRLVYADALRIEAEAVGAAAGLEGADRSALIDRAVAIARASRERAPAGTVKAFGLHLEDTGRAANLALAAALPELAGAPASRASGRSSRPIRTRRSARPGSRCPSASTPSAGSCRSLQRLSRLGNPTSSSSRPR